MTGSENMCQFFASRGQQTLFYVFIPCILLPPQLPLQSTSKGEGPIISDCSTAGLRLDGNLISPFRNEFCASAFQVSSDSSSTNHKDVSKPHSGLCLSPDCHRIAFPDAMARSLPILSHTGQVRGREIQPRGTAGHRHRPGLLPDPQEGRRPGPANDEGQHGCKCPIITLSIATTHILLKSRA